MSSCFVVKIFHTQVRKSFRIKTILQVWFDHEGLMSVILLIVEEIITTFSYFHTNVGHFISFFDLYLASHHESISETSSGNVEIYIN